MKQDLAPLVAAQAMVVERVDDQTIVDRLQRTFHLDVINANAAVAAAHILVRL